MCQYCLNISSMFDDNTDNRDHDAHISNIEWQ